jgi:hypothetical protein
LAWLHALLESSALYSKLWPWVFVEYARADSNQLRCLQAVDAMGYAKPSPIQMAAIPLGMQFRDVIGVAETVRIKFPSSTNMIESQTDSACSMSDQPMQFCDVIGIANTVLLSIHAAFSRVRNKPKSFPLCCW